MSKIDKCDRDTGELRLVSKISLNKCRYFLAFGFLHIHFTFDFTN